MRPAGDISVVICTQNRAASLALTLQSVSRTNLELCREVLVVDNNSRDNTREVAHSFINRLPNLTYLFEPVEGSARARNTGVRGASGSIVAFVDDDVQIGASWLEMIAAAFATHDVAAVSGRVVVEGELPSWWHQEFSWALGTFDLGREPILFSGRCKDTAGVTANLSFRRSIFRSVGLFDEALGRFSSRLTMGEDAEMCQRILRQASILYQPEILAVHRLDPERMKKSYLRRWFFRLGQWHGSSGFSASVAARSTRPARFYQTAARWAADPFKLEIAMIWLAGSIYGRVRPVGTGRPPAL